MTATDQADTPATRSLSASAYGYLLARLRGGHLRDNERLVEADIASQLGVSRVPVRQALLQLVAEGYLVSSPRGYRVPTLTPQDVQDVFELRLLLEPRAAAIAARDITPEQLRDADSAIADARSAHASQDAHSFFSAGRAFRDAWLRAVGNTRLVASITRYADQVVLVRHVTLDHPDRQRTVIAGYESLRAAFARHDSVAAGDAMLRHVLAAERDFAQITAAAKAG
jgi:DNA-binding GntR family transcriptional regulator